ncbi:dephospho-CoA kinase [bacterium]|nr:dephospho-CoA kinase [bacterium]
MWTNGIVRHHLPAQAVHLSPHHPVSSSSQPPVVGLLGGIGSGKSAIARGLAGHFKTVVIDADRIGHQVLTFPGVISLLRQAFGDAIFDGDQVDRKCLASAVFGDEPSHLQARCTLEQIVHPEIERVAQSQIAAAEASTELIVLDAAVMLEAGWDRLCDFLVFIETPFEDRLNRIHEQRDWTDDEIQRREASQLPLDEKRKAADFVVDNSGSLEQSICQLTQFLTEKLAAHG